MDTVLCGQLSSVDKCTSPDTMSLNFDMKLSVLNGPLAKELRL